MKTVFVLIDAKIPPQGIDIDFVEELQEEGVSFSVIFTKTDKTTQKEVHKNRKLFEQKLKKRDVAIPNIFMTSSVRKRGERQILEEIEGLMS